MNQQTFLRLNKYQIFISTQLIRWKIFSGEIINGTPADIKDYPYQVSVRNYNAHFCGGVILDETHVLTAARCIVDGGDLSVRVGWNTNNKKSIVRKVAAIKKHPEFGNNHGVPIYDVAVVKVNESFAFDETINAAILFKAGEELTPGTEGVVTGYNENLGQFEFLSVTLPILGKNLCNGAYEEWGGLFQAQFCAGYYGSGGRDICEEGGLGSPMAIDGKVAGIVSWGYDCNKAKYPRVFTKISVFHDWIYEQLGN